MRINQILKINKTSIEAYKLTCCRDASYGLCIYGLRCLRFLVRCWSLVWNYWFFQKTKDIIAKDINNCILLKFQKEGLGKLPWCFSFVREFSQYNNEDSSTNAVLAIHYRNIDDAILKVQGLNLLVDRLNNQN
jgi:hypothetical protein